MNEPQVLHARSAVPTKAPPKRIEGRRVCSDPKCRTVLSSYNKDDKCYLHQPRKTIRIRGRTPSEIMDKETTVPYNCPSCIALIGRLFEEASKILLDGIVHVPGMNGKGTICED